ncbi:hypothetical protein BJ165DRAFT_1410361 [Panaeolus papilionaceus]|nr:hypothetical protein BJ165DRAFT_1410361 [Panaeolus papilionaceus]
MTSTTTVYILSTAVISAPTSISDLSSSIWTIFQGAKMPGTAIVYIIIGAAIGAVICWLFLRAFWFLKHEQAVRRIQRRAQHAEHPWNINIVNTNFAPNINGPQIA